MLVFATCIILKRQVGPSVAVLATVIIGQAIAYGLVFDLVSVFFCWYVGQLETYCALDVLFAQLISDGWFTIMYV